MTVRICYGGGVGGGLYHSQTNTTWFIHEPGLVVLAPGTVYDAKGLLKSAIRDDNPVIYRGTRSCTARSKKRFQTRTTPFPLAKLPFAARENT